ncbi:hypothetical protein P389DRAFT_51565 [Cystobasidium minutum MCA 4210]|uniref:uncharacterized protein n=1 Tax=Cystobasidium minutum MCA 4210 TaxID=1397322 RepID=UPI0034CECE55|eukprot:jgi/Rhomi1/51565/CE51564_922
MNTTTQPQASTSKNAYAIDPELFKRIQPADYLSRFLQEGYRPDGRRANEFRKPALNAGSISSADGSALVRLGETTVLCGIRAEVAEPDLLAPNSGFLVPNVDLPAMCSSEFRPGPPSDEAQVLSNRIRNIALASRLLPLHTLCIKPGKAVWVLYADIVCINYDGNITDAALLALTAALKNTQIPVASWDEDTDSAVAASDERIPLKLSSTTLSASFGVTEEGALLCDPTSFEEPLCQTRVTIALDEKGTLRHVYQAGPGRRQPQNPAALLHECISLTRERYKQLAAVL